MAIVTVTILNFRYNPESVNISAGDAVQWLNRDVMKHNAKRTTEPVFDTGLLSQGATSAPITFNSPAETGYDYSCTPHPGMKGKIVVSESESFERPEGLCQSD